MFMTIFSTEQWKTYYYNSLISNHPVSSKLQVLIVVSRPKLYFMK